MYVRIPVMSSVVRNRGLGLSKSVIAQFDLPLYPGRNQGLRDHEADSEINRLR